MADQAHQQEDPSVNRRISLMVGIVRLLRDRTGETVIQKELSQLLNKRSVTLQFEANGLMVTGLKDDVRKACTYIHEKYTSKVCYDTLEIAEPDLHLDYSTRAKFQTDVISDLEASENCVIEVRTKGPKSLDALIASNSNAESRENRSQLMIVEGNLLEHSADVLVNTVLFDTKDLKASGPLPRLFATAGGPELEQAYALETPPVKFGVDIVATAASGSLQAKRIYHIAFRGYKNDTSVEMLYEAICKCLNLAKTEGLRTIAFPTLGCGKLGYHSSDVAHCFSRAANVVGGLRIVVVAMEHSILEVIKQNLTDKDSRVIFHINTLSDDSLNTVREKLKSRVMNLVITIQVPHSVVGQLPATVLTKLDRLKTKLIEISVDKPNGLVNIKAPSQRIEVVRSDVLKILDAEKRRLSDPANIKNTKGVAAYLKALAADPDPVVLPLYWSPGSSSSPFGSSQYVAIQAGTTTYTEIELLLKNTWEHAKVGQGNDAKNLTHKTIMVKNIWRVESPRLYTKYRSKRKEFCLAASQSLFPSINGLSGEDEVASGKIALPTLKQDIIPETNEYLLLHGTKKEMLDIISNQGLDARVSQSVFFGNGSYCAESSTKADQYADYPTARIANGHPLYMYVLRVLLGHPYVAKKPYQYIRPPCKQAGCTGADRCKVHPAIHDSVIGVNRPDGARLLFREFIIYHPDQVYPEYLVEYVRQ